MSYREDLYASYSLHPRHATTAADTAVYERVYAHYLRGWLPQDPATPVVDLGCGDGKLLATLAHHGFREIVGIDRSPVQVERSRRLAPSAEVLLGDVGDVLRSRPRHFGAIFCIDVLEHLTRDELLATLRLCSAALRPGGVLIAQVPNAESPFCGSIRYGDLTHELAFTSEVLSHLFAATGFERCDFRECGPVAKDWKGVLRLASWRLLRLGIRAWNLVEVGGSGSGIYTRVMLARAVSA
jgi:2-polyprenyl-3-methyl-5-hydroxy-6-metoxy-1,4-benzoquinol methylase